RLSLHPLFLKGRSVSGITRAKTRREIANVCLLGCLTDERKAMAVMPCLVVTGLVPVTSFRDACAYLREMAGTEPGHDNQKYSCREMADACLPGCLKIESEVG